jgi:type IV pilus assembly protein PilE
MKMQNGFSLFELMVVVAVVAILSVIALPAYNDYVTRGKIPEATANLSDLQVKMAQFYQDNRNYGTPDGGNCGKDAGGVVRVPMPNFTPPAGATQVKYFAFVCSVLGAGQQFALVAIGTGSMVGFTYIIDQSKRKISIVGAGTNYNAGWRGNPNCWVTRKGGLC